MYTMLYTIATKTTNMVDRRTIYANSLIPEIFSLDALIRSLEISRNAYKKFRRLFVDYSHRDRK